MFHTSAFSASIANSGALLQLTEIPDSILPASGSGLLSSRLAYLMALAFAGVSLTRGHAGRAEPLLGQGVGKNLQCVAVTQVAAVDDH